MQNADCGRHAACMALPGVVAAADADRGWRTRSRRAGVLKTRSTVSKCWRVVLVARSMGWTSSKLWVRSERCTSVSCILISLVLQVPVDRERNLCIGNSVLGFVQVPKCYSALQNASPAIMTIKVMVSENSRLLACREPIVLRPFPKENAFPPMMMTLVLYMYIQTPAARGIQQRRRTR